MWESKSIPQLVQLRGLWGPSADDLYAVGFSNGMGTMFHFDGKWMNVPVKGSTDNLYAISGSSDTDIYAVGANALIIRRDNSPGAALQFVAVPPPLGVTYDLRSVWVPNPGEFIAVGHNGLILHGTMSGDRLDSVLPPSNKNYNGIWGAANVLYMTSGDGQLYSCTNWAPFMPEVLPAIVNQGLLGVWGNAAGELYVTGDHGALLHRFP
jgi:hypothetical protein